jgi:hypothetical protein
MNNDTHATVTLSWAEWDIILYGMKVATRNGMTGDLPSQASTNLACQLVKHKIWMTAQQNDKVNV